jgi:hypothetical protein
MFIDEFFKGLIRSRVEGVEIGAKGKVLSSRARVQGRVASKFNGAIDGSVDKAKGAAKGAAKGGKAKDKPEGQKMGFPWFGKKGDQKAAASAAPAREVDEESAEGKTQAINIGQFEDANFKPCVGWVVVMNGVQKGRDFRLVAGRNRIGTDADMEVVLTDPYVSSHHATIVFDSEGVYRLSDAGSTNGSRVNGKKVDQAQIIDNDSLQIGHTELRFKALE